MAIFYKPEQYVYHFLRSQLTDLERDGLPQRLSSLTQTFSGDGSKTSFVVNGTVDSFVTVKVNTVLMTPYLHYNIDIVNKKVVFITAPASGTDNVEIVYKSGTGWIYPDKPRDDLVESSYPRISVLKINHSSNPQGVSEDDSIDNVSFQIDILSYKDVFITYDSEPFEGQDVVDLLSRQVISSIRREWRDNLGYVLFDPRIINSFNADFEPDKNIFRNIVEVSFSGFNLGE